MISQLSGKQKLRAAISRLRSNVARFFVLEEELRAIQNRLHRPATLEEKRFRLEEKERVDLEDCDVGVHVLPLPTLADYDAVYAWEVH